MRTLICALVAVALLGGCQSTTVPQSSLVGCTAYASALESLAVQRRAGLLSDQVVRQVNELRAVATPICTADVPPADAQAVLDTVLLQLEAILAQAASKGAA